MSFFTMRLGERGVELIDQRLLPNQEKIRLPKPEGHASASPLGRFQRREDLTPPPARPKAASTSSVVSSSDSTTPDGAPGP